MTPGGALLGHTIDARLGGLVAGCTPTTGAELKFLVESKSFPTHPPTHPPTHSTYTAAHSNRLLLLTTHPPTKTDTTCPVVTLLPGGNYTLREFIHVLPGRSVPPTHPPSSPIQTTLFSSIHPPIPSTQ